MNRVRCTVKEATFPAVYTVFLKTKASFCRGHMYDQVHNLQQQKCSGGGRKHACLRGVYVERVAQQQPNMDQVSNNSRCKKCCTRTCCAPCWSIPTRCRTRKPAAYGRHAIHQSCLLYHLLMRHCRMICYLTFTCKFASTHSCRNLYQVWAGHRSMGHLDKGWG